MLLFKPGARGKMCPAVCVTRRKLTQKTGRGGDRHFILCAQINLLWITLPCGVYDKISFKKIKKNSFSSELYCPVAELILFYKAVGL